MNITTPPAVPAWVLAGPVGPNLDTLLAHAIHMGCSAEVIDASTGRYRLQGPLKVISDYSEQIAKLDGYSLTDDKGLQAAIVASAAVAPARPYRRTTYLSGPAFGHVARAVDRHLQVAAAGPMRWGVTGTTAAQLAWWAVARQISEDEAREQWGLTPEQAAREDAELSIPAPTVFIELPSTLAITSMPARRTTQDVTRDAQGEIVRTETVERDAP